MNNNLSNERQLLLNKLKEMIGHNVKVYIDRPIGFYHKGITYTQNYGYIKEYIASDGEYQDTYVLGINEPIETFTGKVIAIIKRLDDIEDKLIVCEENKDFSDEEIKSLINFQEQYFKSKIIR